MTALMVTLEVVERPATRVLTDRSVSKDKRVTRARRVTMEIPERTVVLASLARTVTRDARVQLEPRAARETKVPRE